MGELLIEFNSKVTSLLWVWRTSLQVTQNLMTTLLAYQRVSSSAVVRVSGQFMEGHRLKSHLERRFFSEFSVDAISIIYTVINILSSIFQNFMNLMMKESKVFIGM